MTTAFVHGVVTSSIVAEVRARQAGNRVRRSHRTRGSFRAGLVLFLASVLEAGIRAIVCLRAGVIDGFGKAMYGSVVTYTTLGDGDVTLPEHWRVSGASAPLPGSSASAGRRRSQARPSSGSTSASR